MSPFTLLGLLVQALLGALANGYTLPGGCSGACDKHDPALIRRDDGGYYRFSTGNRISYASAPSISGPWTGHGSVVAAGSSINLPGNQDLWAPDVARVNGLYHVYYSVSTFGSQNSAIGLATSPNMEPSTWIDRGSVGIRSDSSKRDNAIVDAGGSTYYMNFGSFWGGLYQVRMNAGATGTVSGSSSYNIAYQPSGNHAIEGPTLIRRNQYWYLFFSSGVCCGYDQTRPARGQEYKIKVCRSTYPTGGFVDRNGVDCRSGGGTVVLESHSYVYGPGGQGVYNDPNLGYILYYHYVDTRIGYADYQKRFGWNIINFSSGWPVI